MYVSSVLSSNIGLYADLLQWAFYAEERRKSREDVDVFISLLLSTAGTLTARQDVSRAGTRNRYGLALKIIETAGNEDSRIGTPEYYIPIERHYPFSSISFLCSSWYL